MKAQHLIKEFKRYNLGPFIEVPCTVLAPVISALFKETPREALTPVSEAVGMGLAGGSYLATGRIPVLLMQNSGICNTLNAITSLNQIYHMPLLLVISWRGEPGRKDAPEHCIMGKKTKRLLEAADIPYIVLSEENLRKGVKALLAAIKKTSRPGAILLRGGLIEKEKDISKKRVPSNPVYGMTRSRAIDIVISLGYNAAYFITTNGFVSRDAFYSLNKRDIERSFPFFYMLGSMGHALPIGIGAARYMKGNKKVIVLDGDGGCMMHMGAMASVAKDNPRNLVHIVFDNASYASTGGQPSLSRNIDFCEIARGFGYKNIYRISKEKELKEFFPGLLRKNGPTFMHILVNNIEGEGERPRISERYSCEEIKARFMERLK